MCFLIYSIIFLVFTYFFVHNLIIFHAKLQFKSNLLIGGVIITYGLRSLTNFAEPDSSRNDRWP